MMRRSAPDKSIRREERGQTQEAPEEGCAEDAQGKAQREAGQRGPAAVAAARPWRRAAATARARRAHPARGAASSSEPELLSALEKASQAISRSSMPGSGSGTWDRAAPGRRPGSRRRRDCATSCGRRGRRTTVPTGSRSRAARPRRRRRTRPSAGGRRGRRLGTSTASRDRRAAPAAGSAARCARGAGIPSPRSSPRRREVARSCGCARTGGARSLARPACVREPRPRLRSGSG